MIIRPPTAETSYDVPGSKLPLFDFRNVTFPAIEHYGFDHGSHTARLALHILSAEYPELDNELHQNALWAAGHLHDAGRDAPFGAGDPGHEVRGAALLDEFLRGHDGYCHDVELRDLACRLVARHHDREPEGPLDRVFADADAYDAARVLPGTSEGLRYLKERTSTLHTHWAQDRANLKRYMASRGWR